VDTALQQWKTEGNYFRFENHNIFYKQSQTHNKPHLVCVHGFPASSWDWQALWPILSQHYQVVALDQLGFGFSDKPSRLTYSVKMQADIIEALLQHLGIVHYHLMAHDFGTLIAQELLTRDLHRNQSQATQPRQTQPRQTQPRQTQPAQAAPKILSLFAMSGSILPELSNPRLIQKLLMSPAGFVISKLFNQRLLQKNLMQVFSRIYLERLSAHERNTLFSRYWQLLAQQKGHRIIHRLNFFLKDRIQYGQQWAHAWQQSQVPIRYVAGLLDPMYGDKGIEQLVTLSTKKDIHAIKHAGHFPHVEAPTNVFDLLEAFIEGVEQVEAEKAEFIELS